MVPDGRFIYLAEVFTDSIAGFAVNDDGTLSSLAGSPFAAGNFIEDVAITPNGLFLYAVNTFDNNITTFSVDATTGFLTPLGVTPVTGTSVPTALTITPDGKFAYVASQGLPGTLSVFSLDSITGAMTEAGFSPIVLGNQVSPVVFTPHKIPGAGMYYMAYIPIVDHVNAYTIDESTGAPTLVASIPMGGGANPRDMVITPDDSTAYVTNQGAGNVGVIDLTGAPGTYPAASFILGFSVPLGNGMTPDQAPRASFMADIMLAGEVSTFDASNSITLENQPPLHVPPLPTPSIASYVWQFDAEPPLPPSASPTVGHIFTTAGVHTVTLTVTNSNQTSILSSQTYTGETMINNGGPAATLQQTFNVLAPIIPPPFPPRNLQGRQVKDIFATQSTLVNVLTWQPPLSGALRVSYAIYRDAGLTQLIGTVPAAGTLSFQDGRRVPGVAYTYYVVSIAADGAVSAPAIVTVPPLKSCEK